MPQVNEAGLALIKSFEGCELTAYQDAVGVWTIGYGHTGDEWCTPGRSITQEEADTLLEGDLHRFEDGVNALCARSLTSNQFSALVSFAYNLGLGALEQSTLMRFVNEGDFTAAAQQFGLWVYAGGEMLEGLVRRRAAEAKLFSTPG